MPASTLIIQNVIHLAVAFTSLTESERERERNSQHPKVITFNVLKGQALVVGDKARSGW